MANFTWEIKRELLSAPPENACCKIAACAAFLRTCGSILYSKRGLGFEIVTENDRVAEYFISLLESVYGVKMLLKEAITDPKSAKDKLTFGYNGERAAQILTELGVLRAEEGSFSIENGISPYIIENDCCALAFLTGAFLGSGSCTLPGLTDKKTGYHLEIVFSGTYCAEQFCELLDRFELIGKCAVRGEHSIVYMKSKDVLSDFLSLVGAQNALKKLISITEEREESNYENRAMNCFIGNCDRTARASAEQVVAINYVDERLGLENLDDGLRQVALARRAFPTESLQTLAERLNLSKSCLSHRLRKLMEIYKGMEH